MPDCDTCTDYRDHTEHVITETLISSWLKNSVINTQFRAAVTNRITNDGHVFCRPTVDYLAVGRNS